MKIVSTFAVVMMKYIYCILLGVFLISGYCLVADQTLPEFRSYIPGTTDIQSAVVHECNIQTNIQQLGKAKSFRTKEECSRNYHSEIGDGIPVYSFSSRVASPSHTLRTNIPSVSICILSSSKVLSPDKSCTTSTCRTNPATYSYRYYIYTLGRILI